MFTSGFLRIAVFASTVYFGRIAAAQDSTLSTTPLSTPPVVSNERLGTGVPSRLPKVDVQRPVFTIQSGGPVAMPIPQFRPIRETNSPNAPANEPKNNLPMTEQSRPWQKSVNDNNKTAVRPLPTNSQVRPLSTLPAPSQVRPATPTTTGPHLTAELPTAERKANPAKAGSTQRPLPRSATTPWPASENPARVLNFSIN